MPKFDSMTCHKCGSIVDTQTDTGEIIFACTACPETRKSEPDDSLMASGELEATGADNYQYEKVLRYVSHFEYNPRPENDKKCPKCKKTDHVRYIRLGPQEKRYYGCSCGKSSGIDVIFT